MTESKILKFLYSLSNKSHKVRKITKPGRVLLVLYTDYVHVRAGRAAGRGG